MLILTVGKTQMKNVFNTSKLVIAAAIFVLPCFMGCGEEPAKAGIDTSKKAAIEITEEVKEEMNKPTKSVGIAD